MWSVSKNKILRLKVCFCHSIYQSEVSITILPDLKYKSKHILNSLKLMVLKRYPKNPKTCLLPLLNNQEKSRVLSMFPALNTTRGVNKKPKPVLWPNPWTHPTLNPYKEQAPSNPALESEWARGTCYLFSLP